MPFTNWLLATCGACAHVTQVRETTWPATRYDPPDGEIVPEECEKCFEPFTNPGEGETAWEADEPPDPY